MRINIGWHQFISNFIKLVRQCGSYTLFDHIIKLVRQCGSYTLLDHIIKFKATLSSEL